MTSLTLNSQNKKLVVIYRVEPGCLGPEGASHVEGFCHFAQQQLKSMDADYISWQVVPRLNKGQPEMQYNVMEKRLTHQQGALYLKALGKSLDEFEEHFTERFYQLIEQYMGR